MPKIFISHSWKNKAIAKSIVNSLKRLGCEVWIDDERINAGNTITDEISHALKWCDTFLLLWSESAATSKLIGLEWSSAITKDKRFITCRIDQTELPEILHGLLYVDFQNFDKAMLKLCEALKLSSPTLRIYLSSTIDDLSSYRQAIRNEIERINHVLLSTENFLTNSSEATILRQNEIASCDLFIGIYAHQYGFVPFGQEKSIIEQEYDVAESLDKPCFLYMLDDEVDWKLKFIDRGEAGSKLDKFKEKIRAKHAIVKFITPSDLAAAASEVMEKFTILKREGYNVASSTLAEIIEKYHLALQHVYGVLDVLDKKETFSMERGYIELSLRVIKSKESSEKRLNPRILIDEKNNVSIVLGLPGTGKTTLLHYLAFEASTQREAIFPIYIRLARFGITGDSLETYLQKEVGQYLSRSEVEGLIKTDLFYNEKCLILLDGLDEVREEDYDSTLRRIHSFIEGHHLCSIIISSRSSGFIAKDWAGYPIYEIESLTEENIVAYIHSWFTTQPKKGKYLVEKLKDRERLYELARTPFLLAMICLIFENDGNIEKRRSSLYRQCTEYLNGLRDWDPQRKRRNIFDDTLQEFFLRETLLKTIAFHFFQLQKNEFTHDELEFIAKRALPVQLQAQVHEILQQIYRRSGVLQQAGNHVYFIHRTIFEYYVACAMLGLDQTILLDWAANPKYEEPFRLYAGLLQDNSKKDTLLKGLWQRNSALALLCVTEMEDSPEQKLVDLLYSVEKIERVRMVQTLESSLNYLPPDSGLRVTLETMQILFRHEKDCEVLWWGTQLLGKVDPTDSRRILWEKFDRDVEHRREKFVRDVRYKFEFVKLPGGEFLMGNDAAKSPREIPAHRVRISPFSIGRFPVTNLLFVQFAQAIGDFNEGDLSSGKDTCPVGAANWYQAVIFCRWLGCRLPTEAEWEYACRAGTSTEYFFGDDPRELSAYAWYLENSHEETHSVGEKLPNPWGLFDIIGNVWEWCVDWYDRGFYNACKQQGIAINPVALKHGERRIIRGGGFYDYPLALRSSARYAVYPDIEADNDAGFRVVLAEGETTC